MSWVQLDQGEWLSMKDHEALFVSESHMFDTTPLNLKLLCSPAALMEKSSGNGCLEAVYQFKHCHKSVM